MESYIFKTAIENWRSYPLEENEFILGILAIFVVLSEMN
jgi:hypothetical protein